MRHVVLCVLVLPPLAFAAPAGFEKLAATEKELREAVVDAALSASAWVPRSTVDAGRLVPPARRAEAVKVLAELARKYVDSPAFAKDYARLRAERGPQPPEKPKTADQLMAEAKAQSAQALKDAEEAMKTMPAEMKAEFRKNLADLAETTRKMNADRATFESLAQTEKEGYGHALEEYREALAAYERERPADAKAALRETVRALLERTAEVKFDAKLVGSRFADPELEAKPSEWKMCFRAGRETCTAARAAAEAWLAR